MGQVGRGRRGLQARRHDVFTTYCVVVMALLAVFAVGDLWAAVPTPDELGPLLTQAFRNAFADETQFRESDLFSRLGYDAEQSRKMAEVTPRPASLSVAFSLTDPEKLEFSSIRVSMSRVHYYDLMVDQAQFDLVNARLDPDALRQGRVRFLGIGRVGIETLVRDADIMKLFEYVKDSRKLQQLRLSIKPKSTIVTGVWPQGFVRVGFRVEGSSKITSSKTIDFDCRKVTLNGVPLPRAAIAAIFKPINPVFDGRKTWLNLELHTLQHEEGGVRCWATMHGPLPGMTVALAPSGPINHAAMSAPPTASVAAALRATNGNGSGVLTVCPIDPASRSRKLSPVCPVGSATRRLRRGAARSEKGR